MLTSLTDPQLLSESRRRFWGHMRATDVLGVFHQTRIIRDKENYSPRFRAAVLRNLVCQASLEVTQGHTYPVRRRLVRKHFNV